MMIIISFRQTCGELSLVEQTIDRNIELKEANTMFGTRKRGISKQKDNFDEWLVELPEAKDVTMKK